MMMVLMQESMKSSLTLNHGLTGISKQLVNALSEEAVLLHQLQLVMAVATPHLVHQMRGGMGGAPAPPASIDAGGHGGDAAPAADATSGASSY